jgi:hypothetical protein
MEMNQITKRIHPLVAGAAPSVMLVSLVGVAAITGLLPTSYGTGAENSHIVTQPATAAASVPAFAAAPAAQQAAITSAPTQQYALVPVQVQHQEATLNVVREVVKHKTIVHHKYVERPAAPSRSHQAQYVQYDSAPRYTPPPVPVSQSLARAANNNSPVGMGVGAVVGGLLGS